MDNKTKPTLNMRYYNKEIDDDLPYVGHLDRKVLRGRW